ncbi:MAG: sigma-70 family RNA polymerase sigma factor [Acidimicrobiia bacterium]|nr:sigma-70 family RNA polymerase sigma factor [Acidimicrobiia bacterium]
MSLPREKATDAEQPTLSPGDKFELHVQPYIPLLYGTAFTLTRNGAEAEDLVQDTLLRAFRSIERFDGAYPKAWLLTILRNTNINRAQKKRPFLFDDPDDPSTDVVDEITPEDLIVEPVFDHAVQSALDDLPASFRAVVDLVDVNGLSYAEAADVLDIPVGTVMSRLHRGRGRIRTRLSTTTVQNRPRTRESQ